MERFFYEPDLLNFHDDGSINYRSVYQQYLRFIRSAGIYEYGRIYTSFALIWHSFLVVMDEFQAEKSFKIPKGY